MRHLDSLPDLFSHSLKYHENRCSILSWELIGTILSMLDLREEWDDRRITHILPYFSSSMGISVMRNIEIADTIPEVSRSIDEEIWRLDAWKLSEKERLLPSRAEILSSLPDEPISYNEWEWGKDSESECWPCKTPDPPDRFDLDEEVVWDHSFSIALYREISEVKRVLFVVILFAPERSPRIAYGDPPPQERNSKPQKISHTSRISSYLYTHGARNLRI